MHLIPLNKYLVVEPIEGIEEEKTNSTILLPDNVKLNDSPFTAVKIIRSSDYSELIRGSTIIVPTHVVDSCTFNNKTYHMVLESHVIGYLHEDDG